MFSLHHADPSSHVIQYVDALAGAGKTWAAGEFACKSASHFGNKFVVSQPGLALTAETIADLDRRFPDVRLKVINSEHDASVVHSIVTHCHDTAAGGEVLIITHAGLERVFSWPHAESWNLIIDEIPSVIWDYSLSLTRNKDFLLQNVTDKTFNASYSQLWCESQDGTKIGENRDHDQIDALLQDYVAKAQGDKWEIFALSENLAKFRREPGDKGRERRLNMFGLMQPRAVEGFRSVTIMGANFKDSILYRYWSGLGVQFEPHPVIRPRYDAHACGSRLTIRYVSERSWSKRQRDRTDTAGESVLDNAARRIAEHFNGKPFLHSINKDRSGLNSPFPVGTNTQQLPHSAHGLNKFQDEWDNIAVLAALNPRPAHAAFLNEVVHLNREEIGTALYREQTYQWVMRISLRNPACDRHCEVVVMDKETADWLAALFPGCNVERLAGEDPDLPEPVKAGRPAIHRIGADQDRAFKAARRAELVSELEAVNESVRVKMAYSTKGFQRVQPCASPIGQSATPMDWSRPLDRYDVSIFGSIYDKRATQALAGLTHGDLIGFLREAWQTRLPSKRDNDLISPAIFDPDAEGSGATERGLANLCRICFVGLDNDGGGISPDELAETFAGLELHVCNSWSSTRECPRWRVIIPMTHMVGEIGYREIVAQINARLRRCGWFGKKYAEKHPGARRHGFDESKFTPSSLFYLPCQAEAGPDASFWRSYEGGERARLSPFHWLTHTVLDHRPDPVPAPRKPTAVQSSGGEHDDRRKAKREDALDRLYHLPAGAAHDEFNALAWVAAANGCSLPDLREHLEHAARMSRHPTERKKEIAGVMRDLEHKMRSS